MSIQTPPPSAGVLGQGVKYPPTLDTSTGRLKLSWGKQSVLDAVTSICLTQPHERPMLPGYGGGTETFEPIGLGRLELSISESIANHEPRALNVQVRVTPGVSGEVIASVKFEVAGEATQQTLTFPLFAGPAATGASL